MKESAVMETMINEGYHLHLACGFLISSLGLVCRPFVLLGFIAGYLKEVFDFYDYGRFDEADMYITFFGAACATIMVLVLFKKFNRYMDDRAGC